MIRVRALPGFFSAAAAAAMLLATGGSTPALAVTGGELVATAVPLRGRPYKFGASPSQAPNVMDCSSFTQYVYRVHGISLLRSAHQQATQGTPVAFNLASLQPGDLLFYKLTRRAVAIDHVGMYCGNNQVIETYRVGIGVILHQLIGTTRATHVVAARRMHGVTSGPGGGGGSGGGGGGAVNEMPIGCYDGNVNGWAYGWALDKQTATTPVTIHVYIDGPAGRGGTFIGAVPANRPRPDVNRATGFPGNHGFAYPIPARFHNQPHRLWIYALDSWGGPNPLLPGSPRPF